MKKASYIKSKTLVCFSAASLLTTVFEVLDVFSTEWQISAHLKSSTEKNHGAVVMPGAPLQRQDTVNKSPLYFRVRETTHSANKMSRCCTAPCSTDVCMYTETG